MAVNGVRDQDRLDEASNFIVWKARILSILDRSRLKHLALNTIAIPVDLGKNEKYEEAMARAKSIILDGVKDHVVPHIAEKDMANAMWEALTKLYQHTSIEEDATRKSAAVIPDKEGRRDRHLPRSIEGDLGSADFHWDHARCGDVGEDRNERSLRGLGGICPEHIGQVDLSRLGGTVGGSSSTRD